MSRTYIPKRLRQRILTESRGLCAYCRTAVAITGARFVMDHIIPEVADGQTVWENLCLACHSCNEFKGVQLSLFDAGTDQEVSLFHPREQVWSEHFAWSQDGSEIIGLTAVGRITIMALNMNHFDIVLARKRWTAVGWHPPNNQ
jgi:hypothetical protein